MTPDRRADIKARAVRCSPKTTRAAERARGRNVGRQRIERMVMLRADLLLSRRASERVAIVAM